MFHPFPRRRDRRQMLPALGIKPGGCVFLHHLRESNEMAERRAQVVRYGRRKGLQFLVDRLQFGGPLTDPYFQLFVRFPESLFYPSKFSGLSQEFMSGPLALFLAELQYAVPVLQLRDQDLGVVFHSGRFSRCRWTL